MPLLPDHQTRVDSGITTHFSFLAAGVLDIAAYVGHLGCPAGHLISLIPEGPKRCPGCIQTRGTILPCSDRSFIGKGYLSICISGIKKLVHHDPFPFPDATHTPPLFE